MNHRAAYAEAGGDLARIDVLARCADVEVFSDGDARCAAAVHPRTPGLGALWDWVGDGAARVAAEEWLRERGCTRVMAPMAVCSWFDHRVVEDALEAAPMAHEPTASGRRWLASGYEPVRRYASLVVAHDAVEGAAMGAAAALSARGFSLEALEGPVRRAELRSLLAAAALLAERVFGDDELFAPVDADVLAAWHEPARATLDPRLLLRARDPSGAVVGVAWALPDTADVARGWFALRTLFLDPRLREASLGAWMAGAVHRAARRAGYTAGVQCMVPVGGDGRPHAQGQVVRRYALLGRHL